MVLHKLLVAYQAAERWSEAIDIIERVCGLEERDEAKAKYTYTIGVVLRDKLEDEDAALERFNEALKEQDSKLILAELNDELWGQLVHTGHTHMLGRDRVYTATERVGESIFIAFEDAQKWVVEE